MNDRPTIDDELAALGEARCNDGELASVGVPTGDVLAVESVFAAAQGEQLGGVHEGLTELERVRVWRGVQRRVPVNSARSRRAVVVGATLAAAAAILLVVTVFPSDAGRDDADFRLRAEAEQLKSAAEQTLAALAAKQGHESRRAGELARRYADRLEVDRVAKEAG